MSDSDPLGLLWQEAVKEYEKDHDSAISIRSLHLTPDKILNDARFQLNTTRSNHRKLISAFEPFYETLRSISMVLGHGLKLVYPPAEAITAAVLVLIDGAQRTSESYDAISEMLEELHYLLERFKGYTVSTLSPELKALVVDGLVHTLRIISISTKAVEQGHFRMFLKTTIHKDKRVQEAIRKLDKLSIRESRSVGAISFSTTNEILKMTKESLALNLDHSQTVQFILEKISDTAARCIDLQAQDQCNKTLLQELKILATPLSEAIKKKQLNRLKPPVGFTVEHDACLAGTRPDILKSIYDWVENRDTPNIFWLYGHPGTGKSAIATTVRHTLANERRLGAACFFRREDVASHSPKAVWCSIGHDLANKHAFLATSIMSKLEQNLIDVDDCSAFDLFKVLIFDTLEQTADGYNDSLVVIMDALDEFGGLDELNQLQRDLLHTLVPNWKRLPSCFKLLVTSRDQGYISHYLRKDSSERISLIVGEYATPQSSADIRTFLEVKFADIASRPPRISQPTLKVSQADITDLVKAAAGLFIWASTITRMVAKRPTVLGNILARVRGTVGGCAALDGLEHLYSGVLKSAYDDFGNDDLVHLVIGAIITARIPLSCESLATLLNIELDDVAVIAGKLQPVLDESSPTLRFVHKSFEDYLIGASCSERFRCDLRAQDERMALACFFIMERELHFNMGSMQSSHRLNKDYPEMHAMISPYVGYGCRFWASHIPSGPLGCALERAISRFLEQHLLFWLEVLSILECFGVASISIALLVSRLKGTDDTVIMKAQQALLFIRTFAPPMSQSYPHIYLSALAFAPHNSVIRHQYINSFPRLPGVLNSFKTWPLQLGVLRGHEGAVIYVSFSSDETRILSSSLDQTSRLWDADTQQQIGGTLLSPENATPTVVTSSPDGTCIVFGSGDGTISLWDIGTKNVVSIPLRCDEGSVESVAFSPDGTRIVSGSENGSICLWDVERQHMQMAGGPLKGHKGAVKSVAFSTDGAKIVSGAEDYNICLWDADIHRSIGEPLRGHEGIVTSVTFSPDGNHILSGSGDCTIRIWNAETRLPIDEPLKGHENWVNCVAFSPDGSRIISGSDDGTIRLWDADMRQPIGELYRRHDDHDSVHSIAFSSDGSRIVSGHFDRTIRLWNAATYLPIGEQLMGHNACLELVSLSPNGHRIPPASPESTIHPGDMEMHTPIDDPIRGPQVGVESVAFSPDGMRIASILASSKFCLWDIDTCQPIHEILGDEPGESLVAFSPDGTRIFSVSHDFGSCLWNAETEELLGKQSAVGATWPCSGAFSSDGTRIVSGFNDGTIYLWDAQTFQMIGEPARSIHRRPSLVAVSRGSRFVSSSYDGDICLWDSEAQHLLGEPLHSQNGSVASIAFSPDENRIVSGHDNGTILFWDAEKHQPIGAPVQGHKGCVESVAFSPHGDRVISGSDDGTVRLWDTETQNPIGEPLHGHKRCVNSVAFSPDGGRVVSGSDDGTIRLWDATPQHGVKPHTHNIKDSFKDFISTMETLPSIPTIALLHDGWIIGPSEERMFWIPHSIHDSVQTLGLLAIIGQHMTTFDLSHFVHGISWTQCYAP